MFTIDPRDATPLWKQIEGGVRRLVASGRLGPDAPVPSVRSLARALRVNPMTVFKAYQQLAHDGVLEVKRGEGTFVARDASRAPLRDRLEELRGAAGRYVGVATTLGVSVDEAAEAVRTAWDRASDAGGGDE